MTSLTNSNIELKNMFGQFMKMNTASSLGLGNLPSNTVTNVKEDLKGITTQSGTAYQGPTIPTTFSSPSKVVERETKVTKYTTPPTNNGSTKDVQPLVVQIETPILNSEPVIAPIVEPVVAPVSAPRPNQKPSIPYPNTVPNPREDLKAITTWSGVTLAGPLVSPPPSKEVDREPETITDQVLTGSTNNVPPLVVQPSPASTTFSTISS
nr:reverse transcriptase domain-containing protein [Tanacetum cinerariifolium]